MTQFEYLLNELILHKDSFHDLRIKISEFLDKNQNPNCGGDLQLTEDQFNAIRRIERGIFEIESIIPKLKSMNSGPNLSEMTGRTNSYDFFVDD